MRHHATIAGLGWLLLSAWSPPARAQAATPPGTLIVNTATVRYVDGSDPLATPIVVTSTRTVTVVSGNAGLVVTKTSLPAGTVPPGTAVGFLLHVENPTPLVLTGVVIADPLDPLLSAPTSVTTGTVPDHGASGGTLTVDGHFDAAAGEVRWTIPAIPAGARFELGFTSVIDPNAPDDSLVRNVTTQASAQDPNGTTSNEVRLAVVAPALSLSKEATRSRAEVGDPIGYRVLVTNTSGALDLSSVRVRDRLPKGLRYLEGSARLDGKGIADPVAAPGSRRELLFDLGALPRGESRALTYVAIPSPVAEGTDAINRATAEAITPAGFPVAAGPAVAAVRVAGSLLTGESVIIGRVFVDDDHDGVVGDGEPGVPAVRVYLEDGTFTFTDVAGKYHMEGVRPGVHVLKVDASTLPEGLAPFASWSRSAGAPGTQFVDVGADQLFKSNVPTGGWGIAVSRLIARGAYRTVDGTADGALETVVFPPLLASAVFEKDGAGITRTGQSVVEEYAALVRERGGRLITLTVEPFCHPVADGGLMSARAERLREEMSRLILASLPPEPDRTAAGGADSRWKRLPDTMRRPGRPAIAPPVEPVASTTSLVELESRVREMTPEPAVLSPAGPTVDAERHHVEVKLPAGLTPRLSINGRTMPDDAIAVRMETSQTQVVFYRYLGVPFREGRNSLVLEGLDASGNAAAWVERIIDRAGPPRHISVVPDDGARRADGRTPVEVRVEVRDAQGLAVPDGTLVTLESGAGEFLGPDADTRQEGFQVTTVQGRAAARMSPGSRMERRTVTASAGEAAGEATFSLDNEVRDWIVAGVGEATIGTPGADSGGTLEDLLDPDGRARARMALYARGPLFGSSMVTLSYDSHRERDRDRLFRALAPDRHFPIYGDSSSQGYDVEGQGRFSLRLDQQRSSLTLGDFTTALGGGDLLRYDRALTGGTGRVETNGFSLQSFGARTPQTQIRDEIPGGGVSGPYRLTRRPVVANSERIVIASRDRFHPERVLRERGMSRFADYDVDYETGTILFKQPVPFQDDDFNPVVIVGLYETLDGDGEETVAGGRIGYRFGGAAEIGTTYVHEQRDGGAFIMRGLDLGVKRALGRAGLELRGEIASTQSGVRDHAGAVAFAASATIGRTATFGGYYRDVSQGYANPSRGGAADVGTVRWGVEGSAALPGDSRLEGEIFTQVDALRGEERRLGGLDWERRFGPLTARSGFREIRAPDPAGGPTASSRLVSAGIAMKIGERLEGSLARQQVVYGAALRDYPTRTSAGLGWRITGDVRAFLREEYDQADEGVSSRTVAGLESRLTRHTVMESRYSLEDALNGARGMAQMGLRTRLTLGQDWLGDLSLERVATTRGAAAGDFTALGFGLEYLPARAKLTTRYELRLADFDRTHLLSAAGATRLTGSLSLFTRHRLFLIDPDDAGARLDGDGLIGLAYRPLDDDRLNFLVKLQGLKGGGLRGAGAPQARSYLGIIETHYQAAPRVHLLGKVALKESQDLSGGASFAARSALYETRLLWDVTARINAGVQMRLLDQLTGGSRVTGAGLETGLRLADDLWLVGGYNVTGFDASGFGDSERREAGPFLSLRFKFDEQTVLGLAQALSREPAQPIPSE